MAGVTDESEPLTECVCGHRKRVHTVTGCINALCACREFRPVGAIAGEPLTDKERHRRRMAGIDPYWEPLTDERLSEIEEMFEREMDCEPVFILVDEVRRLRDGDWIDAAAEEIANALPRGLSHDSEDVTKIIRKHLNRNS